MVFINGSTRMADLIGTEEDIIVPDPLGDRTVADLCGTLEEVEVAPSDEEIEAIVLQSSTEVYL